MIRAYNTIVQSYYACNPKVSQDKLLKFEIWAASSRSSMSGMNRKWICKRLFMKVTRFIIWLSSQLAAFFAWDRRIKILIINFSEYVNKYKFMTYTHSLAEKSSLVLKATLTTCYERTCACWITIHNHTIIIYDNTIYDVSSYNLQHVKYWPHNSNDTPSSRLLFPFSNSYILFFHVLLTLGNIIRKEMCEREFGSVTFSDTRDVFSLPFLLRQNHKFNFVESLAFLCHYTSCVMQVRATSLTLLSSWRCIDQLDSLTTQLTSAARTKRFFSHEPLRHKAMLEDKRIIVAKLIGIFVLARFLVSSAASRLFGLPLSSPISFLLLLLCLPLIYAIHVVFYRPLDRIVDDKFGYYTDPGRSKRHQVDQLRRLRWRGDMPPAFANGWYPVIESHLVRPGEAKSINMIGNPPWSSYSCGFVMLIMF